MHVIIANYADESIALLQWAFENQLQDVYVLSVNTGWQAVTWPKRIDIGMKLAQKLGFIVIHLNPQLKFVELIKDRKEFPQPKFQWCAGILKGLPILEWLDAKDPFCEATIMLANRVSPNHPLASKLREFEEESEYYGERKLWRPLLKISEQKRDELIAKTGLAILGHRSLECCPCVNSNCEDVLRLSKEDLAKTYTLEQELNSLMLVLPEAMHAKNIKQLKEHLINNENKTTKNYLSMGCGAPYACGE